MSSTKKPYPWSFSKLKNFATCPKQYYHLNVIKDFTQPETDAMRYGTIFHEAAEEYIRDGKEFPKKFAFALPVLDALKNIKGEKLCEIKMGLTKDLEPCDFFADDVWFRGIADLNIMQSKKKKAFVVDYKTGKNHRYADTGQLELMALATFAHFPEIDEIKGSLLFVVPQKSVEGTYLRSDIPELWGKWMRKYKQFATAHKTDVWNANPSGLCRQWCLVTSCPHNGRSN